MNGMELKRREGDRGGEREGENLIRVKRVRRQGI